MLYFPTPVELTVPAGKIQVHVVTKKDKPRLKDGQHHPVRIVQPAKVRLSGK